MAVYKREKEILVSTCDFNLALVRNTDCFWRQQRLSSIYLHTVLNLMKKQKSNPTKTLLVLILAFLIIYLFTKYNWAIYTSIGLGIIGVFSSYLTKIIDAFWMKLAWVLSLFVPKIILGIVFYLILTPIAFITKLFSKDELLLKNKYDSFAKNFR